MEFPGAGVGSNSDFRSCPWTRCGLNTNPEPARDVHYLPNLMTSTQFSLLGFCEAHRDPPQRPTCSFEERLSTLVNVLLEVPDARGGGARRAGRLCPSPTPIGALSQGSSLLAKLTFGAFVQQSQIIQSRL